MSPGRLLAIAGRILNQFRHDVRTLALIAIVPLVVMALVGYLISEEKEPLPVAIADADVGTDTPAGRVVLGEEIRGMLTRESAIALEETGSAQEAESAVRSGEVAGAILLPADLTERVVSGEPVSVRVLVLGTDPGLSGPILGAVGEAMGALTGEGAGGPGIAPPPVTVERVPLMGGERLSSLDFYAPALIVVFAFLFTFMLTSVAFLRERSSGTLERLMASPVTRLEVLLGYLLGFVGFAVFQGLLILGYAVLILDVAVAGPIWLVLLVLVVLVTGVVNLGIALSFYARNELQVVQFIPLILLPQTFLGGLFWPVETIHPILRWISQVFPLTHSASALRTVMVGGGGFGDIAGRLSALATFAVAMVGLGVVALRRSAR